MDIKKLKAIQVIDSRNQPTVEVILNDKYKAIAPSGKSTGIYEAKEIRDHKKNYFFGKSVQNVIHEIKKLKLNKITNQIQLDTILKNKMPQIGSNGSIAISMAYSRLKSNNNLIPYLSKLSKTKQSKPIIFANVINGGQHANNMLNFQEFMITPLKIKDPFDQVRAISEIYNELQNMNKTASIGDEGGLSIQGIDETKALSMIETAISKTSYNTNKIRIALDVAASEFYNDELYDLHKKITAGQLIDVYQKMIKEFKLYSIEDPFDQTDYVAWKEFNKKNKNLMIVGDDLTVTNKELLQKAISEKLCNSMIVKPNQIGTVSDTIEAIKLAKKNNIELIASHRSGDSEDSFIVDFAFAMGAKHMKIGSPCRAERTSKYNRFLELTQR